MTKRPQVGLQDTRHHPREMVQWLRIMTNLPEDPGSIPSTHMVAHSATWGVTPAPGNPAALQYRLFFLCLFDFTFSSAWIEPRDLHPLPLNNIPSYNVCCWKQKCWRWQSEGWKQPGIFYVFVCFAISIQYTMFSCGISIHLLLLFLLPSSSPPFCHPSCILPMLAFSSYVTWVLLPSSLP